MQTILCLAQRYCSFFRGHVSALVHDLWAANRLGRLWMAMVNLENSPYCSELESYAWLLRGLWWVDLQISLPLALVQPPGSDELLTAYLALNQVTPFVRFAHLTANQALLEALDGEWYLHIVDLDIVHGLQWPPFMQALVDVRADQGAGLPQLCITGIGKDRQVLEMTGRRLVNFAQSIDLPFEFIPLIHQNLDSLRPTMLRLRTGEALAVNCMLQLHTLLDEEGTGALQFFLGMLHSLNPRVVTLAEREANTNQAFFLDRFAEALHHYSILFDSLEATLPPTSLERTRVEQLWFWKEISNIVAATREGQESSSSLDSHVVRYQKFDQWRIFMETAGFQLLPTSKFALAQARLLLRLHYPSEGYRLVEDDAGCLLLGWQDYPLFAVSSWNAVWFHSLHCLLDQNFRRPPFFSPNSSQPAALCQNLHTNQLHG